MAGRDRDRAGEHGPDRVPAHPSGPRAARGHRAVAIPTDGYLVVGYVAVFLLLYSFAVQIDDLRLVVIAPVVLLGVSVWPLLRDDEPIGEWLGTILAVTVPVAVGRFVRRERERTRQMSVAEERARIARELHDVVAHGVSVIAVQADAAEAALEHDPGARGDAAAQHPRLRRTTRWPRCGGCSACSADDEARPGPQPGLAQLPGLVEQAAQRCRSTLDGRGRAAAAPACARPHRVPDRAGGAHQRPQARGRRARRPCALTLARRRARGRGPRRRRPGPTATATGTGSSACASACASTAAAARRRRPPAAASRSSRELPLRMTSVAARRRPGAGPQRLPADPRAGRASRSSARRPTAARRSSWPASCSPTSC